MSKKDYIPLPWQCFNKEMTFKSLIMLKTFAKMKASQRKEKN